MPPPSPWEDSQSKTLSLRIQSFNHSNTRIHVRLLGPCFKTGRLEPLLPVNQALNCCSCCPSLTKDTLLLNQGYNHSALSYIPWPLLQWSSWVLARLQVTCLKSLPLSCIAWRRVWLQTLPFQQFHVLFDSLFRVLFIFPSRYLFAIGLSPIFSFRRSLPPIRAAFPNYSTLRECITETLAVHVKDGIITLSDTPSKDCGSLQFRRGPAWMTFSSIYNSDSESLPDFKTELFPLHSPLLRESLLVSFPPLIDMLKFSGYSHLIRGHWYIEKGPGGALSL